MKNYTVYRLYCLVLLFTLSCANVVAQDFLLPPTLVYPSHKEEFYYPPTEFRWNEVYNASSYTIEITLDVTFLNFDAESDLKINNIVDTIYYPPEDFLLFDTMYFWRVKAMNNMDDESDWSFISMFLTGRDISVMDKGDKYVSIEPMPIINEGFIELREVDYTTAVLYIFSYDGKLVESRNFVNETMFVDAENFSKGSYFFVFAIKNNVFAIRPVIIE